MRECAAEHRKFRKLNKYLKNYTKILNWIFSRAQNSRDYIFRSLAMWLLLLLWQATFCCCQKWRVLAVTRQAAMRRKAGTHTQTYIWTSGYCHERQILPGEWVRWWLLKFAVSRLKLVSNKIANCKKNTANAKLATYLPTTNMWNNKHCPAADLVAQVKLL